MRAPSPYRALGLNGWRHRAACAGADPNLFSATGGRSAERAKAWCHVCPVRAECLESALVCEDTSEIRGGMTASERADIHAMRAKRLDPSRVRAALDGYDIHLNARETTALCVAALLQGMAAPQLAVLLKCRLEQAEKLHATADWPDETVAAALDALAADPHVTVQAEEFRLQRRTEDTDDGPEAVAA